MKFHKVYKTPGASLGFDPNWATEFIFTPRIFKSPATLIFGWGRKTTHHKDGTKTVHVRQERR